MDIWSIKTSLKVMGRRGLATYTEIAMRNGRLKATFPICICLVLAASLWALCAIAPSTGATERTLPATKSSVSQVTAGDVRAATPVLTLTSETAIRPGRDAFVDNQWALDRIHVRAAWGITPQREVTVAVLDTGIDNGHEDLQDAVVESVNFTASPTTEDIYGHGTHVAGIIAARVNNSRGIAGVYQNVKLLNVKVADDTGDCSSVNVAKGIVWAADHGANVINLSLTITRPSTELEQAVGYAWNKGAVIIAAVGNAKKITEKSYPAVHENCVAVVGTNNDDFVASSLAGKEVIAAPGYKIFSTLPGNRYGYKDGNSMATAFVSAAAAIAWAYSTDLYPGLANDKIVRSLKEGTVPIVSRMLTYRFLDYEKLITQLSSQEK